MAVDTQTRLREVMLRGNRREVFYRSSLVVSYPSTKEHHRYIEFRVWGQSRRRGVFPEKMLWHYMDLLSEAMPEGGIIIPIARVNVKNIHYEEDEPIGIGELAPELTDEFRHYLSDVLGIPRDKIDVGTILDRVFGTVSFDGYYYYFVAKFNVVQGKWEFVVLTQGMDIIRVEELMSMSWKGIEFERRKMLFGEGR